MQEVGAVVGVVGGGAVVIRGPKSRTPSSLEMQMYEPRVSMQVSDRLQIPT